MNKTASKGKPVKSTDPLKPYIMRAMKRHGKADRVTNVRQTTPGIFTGDLLKYIRGTGKYEPLGDIRVSMVQIREEQLREVGQLPFKCNACGLGKPQAVRTTRLEEVLGMCEDCIIKAHQEDPKWSDQAGLRMMLQREGELENFKKLTGTMSPATYCECMIHRYEICHTIPGDEQVYSHSQGDWDTYLKGIVGVKTHSSASWKHGMKASELEQITRAKEIERKRPYFGLKDGKSVTMHLGEIAIEGTENDKGLQRFEGIPPVNTTFPGTRTNVTYEMVVSFVHIACSGCGYDLGHDRPFLVYKNRIYHDRFECFHGMENKAEENLKVSKGLTIYNSNATVHHLIDRRPDSETEWKGIVDIFLEKKMPLVLVPRDGSQRIENIEDVKFSDLHLYR